MRRSLLRRVFRRKILLLVSLLLILLLSLLLVLVHTPWVRAFALKKAAAYVESQYGIKLVADSLQYDLATLRIWLTNVSLTVGKSDFPAFFQADEVRVRLPISFLFKRGFHLKELAVERPRVRIIYSDRGIPNTPSLPSSTTPLSFILERASIREGLFVFSDPAGHIDIKMPGIRIDVAWLERSVHAIRLAAKDEGLAEIGRTRIPIRGLMLAGVFDPDQAAIKELSVSLDQNKLQIKGQVKDLLSPKFQLEAQADFAAPDIQRILNLQADLEGRLELRANFSGGFKKFTAEGKLAGRNLGFGSWRKASLDATFRWDGGSFLVPSFRVESPLGNLFGKAGSSAQDGGRENGVEVSWDSLDLRRVLEDLKLPLRIASRSEGNLQARWSGSFFPSLRAKADIKLAPTRESHSGVVYPPLSGWIKADLEPSSSAAHSSLVLIRGKLARSGKSEIGIDAKAALSRESLDLSAVRLSLPGGVIDASARYPLRNKNGPLGFSIRAEKIVLERTAEFLGFPQDLRGTIDLDAKGAGGVDSPEIEFRATGENLKYGNVELGRANLEGKSAARSVRIPIFLGHISHFQRRCDLASASLRHEGDVFVRQPGARFSIKTRLSGKQTPGWREPNRNCRLSRLP